MDIAAAQLLFDRLGRLDRIDLVTDPARPVEEVRRAVLALLPPELTVKRPQQRNAQIERMTRAFRLNVSILSVVALLVGLFLVYNTVSFAVLRRRREIGILRSLGLSSAGIVRLLLTEVVLVGIVGGIVGIGFGVALSNGVLQTLAATVSNLYYQSLVPPRLTWVSSDVLVQGLLIGLVVAVVGSLGPIREAVAADPAPAGRLSAAPGRRRAGTRARAERCRRFGADGRVGPDDRRQRHDPQLPPDGGSVAGADREGRPDRGAADVVGRWPGMGLAGVRAPAAASAARCCGGGQLS